MKFRMPVLFTVFACLSLMATVAVVVWSVKSEQQQFYKYQQRLFKSEVQAASNDIEAFVDTRQRSMLAFANDNKELIAKLAVNPDDEDLKHKIKTRLRGRFPEYFAFTIASPKGQDLLDEFSDFIGPKCKLDIKEFTTHLAPFAVQGNELAEAKSYIGAIHPQLGNYHFDIMVPWRKDGALKGTFFVSFYPTGIQKTLGNYENDNHNLFLINKGTEGLIEVTKNGTREDIFNDREINLSEEELVSIQARHEVQGTRWMVISFPDKGFFETNDSVIWSRARLIIFIVVIVWIVTIFLAGIQEGKKRQIALERKLTSEESERQRVMFEAVFNDVFDAMILTSPERQIIKCNPAVSRIFGYEQEDIAGRTTEILYETREDFEEQGRLRYNLPAREKLKPYESNYRRKNGEVFPAETMGFPIQDREGNILGFVGAIRDITERKQAEYELDLQKYALDEHAIVSITDIKGNITYANDKFCDVSCYSREELLGQNHSILKSGEHPPEFFADLWKTIANGKVWHGEIKNRNKAGDDYWLKATIVPFLNKQGEPFQYVAIRTEITDRKKSEQDLRDSQRMINDMLENTQEGFWQIDNNTCTVEVNTAMCEILGRNRDDIIGREIFDFVDDENEAIFRQQIKQRQRGQKGSYEISLQRADGANVPCIGNATPIYDDQGERTGSVGMWTDITERRKIEDALEEGEERYRQLANVSSDWVWEMDENLRFSYISKGFLDLSGEDFSFFLGKTREQLSTADELAKPHWRKHLSDLKEKREFRDFWYRLSLPGEKIIYIKTSGGPIFDNDGNFQGYRGTGSNITEQVRAKHELEKEQQDANKANQAKSEFLSSMSHELRTPMNAILGFAQMLEFNPKEPLSKTQKGCVDHIMKGGQHLLKLINEILDLAKIEAGRVDISIENISPSVILNECKTLVATLGEETGISIVVPDTQAKALRIRADHTRFKQILLNLMTNAIKYNRVNGTVTIGFKEMPNEMLRISVTDTGWGIAKGKTDELFKPFNRLGAENSAIEGTGIGLVVCKDLVKIMGGKIGVESEAGKGSTFWFEMPLANHLADNVDVEEVVESAWKSDLLEAIDGSILYVEDNPENIELMELIVERINGLSMTSARSAEAGIDLAKNERPDLIILDINLPGMSGIDAIKELQENEKTNHIPILALSAAATKEDIEKGMAAGFFRYLTKPIQVPELVDAIRDALETT